MRLSCVEDDALGESLEVLWDAEIDAKIVDQTNWQSIAGKGFDQPHLFSAYLNTLRWNCVTSTNAKLFQSPYRAGIEVRAFQLEPLRKALAMPRVNLFIADAVGLGKTIEAGLILRELILRQKVRRMVICCPPSVVRQWKDEMEQRFGLVFMIYDRDYVIAKRQERGYSVNPWTTHNRFIISQALIRNERYAAPLRDWLGDSPSGSLLILDEAHNAAPSSSTKYAVDSKLTRSIRDLTPRFEHKLFLSATPHNGHSNSFSALLEMLDPQKFCRGIPVHHASRDAVMVRRLKHDLREVGERFPERKVVRVDLDGLPNDAPELQLSRLLQSYREAKEERLANASNQQRTASMLVVTALQKRLLSSPYAFSRTLDVHAQKMEELRNSPNDPPSVPRLDRLQLLLAPPSSDDERSELPEDIVADEESTLMVAATEASAGPSNALEPEIALLDEMRQVATQAKHLADSRTRYLIDWIRDHLCPGLGTSDAVWNNRRVLIFTEYTDTKDYLYEQLSEAVRAVDQAQLRIKTFQGDTREKDRELIKAAFNADPAKHPLRILIATDAAREGLNLQNHCADLFHFDVPWNPSRMEQRNGRIDRKLQRSREVRCHYFVVKQRAEDRVLDVLVDKSETIHRELGSLAPVVAHRMDSMLSSGIEHRSASLLSQALDGVDSEVRGSAFGRVVQEDLETVRDRKAKLFEQIERLERILKESRDWMGLDDRHFRNALSASLEVLGAEPLKPLDATEATEDPSSARWMIPRLHETMGADHTWAHTLDSLRSPKKKGEKPWQWRQRADILPVVFRDPGSLDGEVVHLHLEHRMVQRLLGRFLAQGFLHDELSRACVLRTDDPLPRVIALGRLAVYGENAARLHDEILAVAAEWKDPTTRGRAQLKPVGEGAKLEVLHLLDHALAVAHQEVPDVVRQRLGRHAAQDVEELHPYLVRRAEILTRQAERALETRGRQEARDMSRILEAQKVRIEREFQKVSNSFQQLTLGFSKDEERQLASNQRHWQQRLHALDDEIRDEPARIQAGYAVKATRIEPVGLVYLWPTSS